MKIYMIPAGWDRELTIKTAFKSGADKICLLSALQKKNHLYSDMDKVTRRFNEEVCEELRKFVEVEILEVNYFDAKSIFSKINNYMKKNEGAEFVLNIATASRYLAVHLSIIAYIKGIGLEFSRAEYNPKIYALVKDGEDIHSGFDGITKLPRLPISVKFSVKEKQFLKILKEKGNIGVKDFVGDARGNADNRLRSEFHYICKKLEGQGIIKIRSKGRAFEARLTQFGEFFVEEI